MMRSARTSTSMALLLWCGCQTPAPAPDPEPSPAAPARDPNAPLTLELEPRPAPWLEEPRAGMARAQLSPTTLVTFGDRVSLHRTPRGLWAVHAERGVLARIDLPEEAEWAGVGEGGSVWAASAQDGQIWRALSARQAARAGGFELVATIPGAVAWDINRRRLVVASSDTVHISEDAGQTWRTSTPEPGLGLDRVFVRHDGVLAAAGWPAPGGERRRTWIGHAEQESWELARYQPERLRRDGAWIWNGAPGCVAALTRGGVHWSSNPSLRGRPGHEDPRGEMLALVHDLRAPGAKHTLPTLEQPPAPADDPALRHAGVEPTCQDPIPTAEQLRGRAREEDGERGPQRTPCRGARCLREADRPAPPSTRHAFYLLADAACAGTDETCAGQAELARPPHLLVFDSREDATTLDVIPPGCAPHRLDDVAGLAVLVCRGEPAPVWTRDVRGEWVHEVDLPSPHRELGGVSMAEDGTLVVHGVCPEASVDCQPSFLRAPGPVGDGQVWAELAVPDALAALPLPGGGALVASAPPSQASQLTLWRVRQDRDIDHLVEVTGLEEPVRGLQLGLDGRVELLIGEGFTPAPITVMGDGRLSGEEAPEER